MGKASIVCVSGAPPAMPLAGELGLKLACSDLLPGIGVMPENSKQIKTHASPELSLVMHCFNQGTHIEATLREWVLALREETKHFEIIVVNAGSNDGSGRAIDNSRRQFPEIRVIHQLRVGHSRSIRRGYEAARGQWVGQIDINGQYEVSDFLRCWQNRQSSDFILGARTHRLDGAVQRLCSTLLRKFIKAIFRIQIHDANVPFRLFRHDRVLPAFQTIPKTTESLNITLAILMCRSNPDRFEEIKIPYRPPKRGKASLPMARLMRLGFSIFCELLSLRLGLKSRVLRLKVPTPAPAH